MFVDWCVPPTQFRWIGERQPQMVAGAAPRNRATASCEEFFRRNDPPRRFGHGGYQVKTRRVQFRSGKQAIGF